MLISKLPPGLKELAEKRRSEQGFSPDFKYVQSAFSWGHTFEDVKFWDSISKGKFTPYYNCKVVNLRYRDGRKI